jgi:hypothetical protein
VLPRRGSRDPGRVGADDSGLQGGGASSTIEFCGAALSEEEFAGFRNNFVGASHLHLHSVPLGCGVESEFFPGFPSFSSLQHLELTGSLDNYGVIQAVARIMEQTPSLEVLTLFLTLVAEEEPAIRTMTMDPQEEYYDQYHIVGIDLQ